VESCEVDPHWLTKGAGFSVSRTGPSMVKSPSSPGEVGNSSKIGKRKRDSLGMSRMDETSSSMMSYESENSPVSAKLAPLSRIPDSEFGSATRPLSFSSSVSFAFKSSDKLGLSVSEIGDISWKDDSGGGVGREGEAAHPTIGIGDFKSFASSKSPCNSSSDGFGEERDSPVYKMIN